MCNATVDSDGDTPLARFTELMYHVAKDMMTPQELGAFSLPHYWRSPQEIEDPGTLSDCGLRLVQPSAVEDIEDPFQTILAQEGPAVYAKKVVATHQAVLNKAVRDAFSISERAPGAVADALDKFWQTIEAKVTLHPDKFPCRYKQCFTILQKLSGATAEVCAPRMARYVATYPENEPLLSWLRKEAPEEVLEPDLPIVDTHHHLWDMRGQPGIQLSGTSTLPPQSRGQWVYRLPECLEDMQDGHNVVKTVLMQVSAGGVFPNHSAKGAIGLPDHFRPLAEVEYAQGVAALCETGTYGGAQAPVGYLECRSRLPRVCAGIVGYVNFQDPQVEELLRAMARLRNFRGVRNAMSDPESEAFCRGIALLEKYDLSFDWVGFSLKRYNPESLANLKAIALKFPKVRIVMNHLGFLVGPRMSPAELEAWKKDIAGVAAACPNVVAKCGGAQMAAAGHGFEKREVPIGSEELCEVMLPYYGAVIDAFGPDRCMFESNFPPDKESCSFLVLFNMFKRVAAAKNLSDAEKRAIFHDTAVRTYRLDDLFGAKF